MRNQPPTFLACFSLRLVAVATLLAASGVGCLAMQPSQVSVATLRISPPSQMVSQKVSRTAYIVLDPAKVPSTLSILVDGADRGGKLTDVQSFVTRDLKNAFTPYFQAVQVIAPEQLAQITAGPPSVIIDVKVDRAEVLVSGTSVTQRSDSIVTLGDGKVEVSTGSASLTWGVALRPSESKDYLFSFADNAPSLQSDDPSTGFRSMFENAIARLMKGYDSQHIEETLRKL